MANVLIRGKPRSGKSTLIARLVQILTEAGKRIGGISTPEMREGHSRVGFEICDMMTGEKGILSHINQKEGPRVSKYRVNLEDLTNIGVLGIKRAMEENVDFIIIDEIGKMELVSEEFQIAVWEALDAMKVIGTIGQISHSFVKKIYERDDLQVITLSIQNRERIYNDLKNQILQQTDD